MAEVEDVLLGVTTAGYRIEGGVNGPGEPANNWVRWERSGRSARAATGDFWARPEPVLDRAAALGCDAFGLTVEWARLEPEEGVFDDAALERYAAILGLCAARGLTPVVTLHHATHPWWLGDEFWLTPGAPDRFAGHVARIAPRLTAACRRWVTVDHPSTVARRGWLVGAAPPGRRGAIADAWAVVDNLLTAQVLADAAIRRAQPDAVVVTTTGASSPYEQDRLLVDLLRARSFGVDRADVDRWVDERRAGHDVASPPAGLGGLVVRRAVAAMSPFGSSASPLRTRLRRPSPRRVLDVVYDGSPLAEPGPIGVDRADPPSLAAWCHEQGVVDPAAPLWVFGHGTGPVLAASVAAAFEARSLGAPLQAYLHRATAWFTGAGAADVDRSSETYGRLIADRRASRPGRPAG
jgi:hypothetical protein